MLIGALVATLKGCAQAKPHDKILYQVVKLD